MVCVHTSVTRFQCKMVRKVLRNTALRSLVSSFNKNKVPNRYVAVPGTRNITMNTGTFPKESKSNRVMCKELWVEEAQGGEGKAYGEVSGKALQRRVPRS